MQIGALGQISPTGPMQTPGMFNFIIFFFYSIHSLCDSVFLETKVCLKTYGAYPQILAPIITPLPPSGNIPFIS
jgi:hypothetical protein